ncbi:DUF1275 family protein [Streptomyces sp. NPDC059785]|uniref:DUF1275 family protein n=1 Tax=unclassified Streptomyces TaxID=2593676 RepID=UPI00364BB7A4
MPDPADAAPHPWPGHRAAVRRLLMLAAGAANAFGFLALGSVFTSVVTANSVLLGLRLGGGSLAAVGPVALALLGYGLGAAAGGLVSAGRGRLPAGGIRAGLALETALLWLSAGVWPASHQEPGTGLRTLLLFVLAIALGCQNGSVRVTAGSDVTTGYLTGLVTSAITALVTRGAFRARDAAVVLTLVAGALAEGAAHRWLSWSTPVLPAVLVTAALGATWWRTGRRPVSSPTATGVRSAR